jgi:hypothetical protein
MAYSVKFHDRNVVDKFCKLIPEAVKQAGFAIHEMTSKGWDMHRKGSKDGSRKLGHIIELRRVRLLTPKPYCGNHPGECAVGGPKKTMSYLEWDDWVRFHAVVNDVLDSLGADADVWSTPQDVKGQMWIRKGTSRRVRYDWEESFNRFGLPLRVWNQGTPDQFAGYRPTNPMNDPHSSGYMPGPHPVIG